MSKEPQFIIKNGVLIDINIPKNCTEITIPDSVTEIGSSAFYHCNSLQSIIIPDSVTKIGNGAFYDCTSLQSIIIPDSVIKIGSSAFDNCTSLQSITIPNSVTKIGYCAFAYCTSLQSIAIPNSVTDIGEWTFDNCTSLQSAVAPRHLDCIHTFNYELQCAKEHIPISYLYLDGNLALKTIYQALHALKEYHIPFNQYQIKQLYSYLHNHKLDEINFDTLKRTGFLQEDNIFTKEQMLEQIER